MNHSPVQFEFTQPVSAKQDLTVARHDHERKLMLAASCSFYHDVDDTHDLHTLSCICAKRVLCGSHVRPCRVSPVFVQRYFATSIRSVFPSTCFWVTIGSGHGPVILNMLYVAPVCSDGTQSCIGAVS